MSTSDTLQVQAVLQSWHVLLYARHATTWGLLLQVLTFAYGKKQFDCDPT